MLKWYISYKANERIDTMFQLLTLFPATGDRTNPFIYVVIVLLAVAAAVAAVVVTKLKKKP